MAYSYKAIAFVPFGEDVESTVSRFLQAVRRQDERGANRFLSKQFLAGELTDPARLFPLVNAASQVKRMHTPTIRMRPRDARLACAEVLLADKTQLRVHLIREHDGHGAWKIYAIEE